MAGMTHPVAQKKKQHNHVSTSNVTGADINSFISPDEIITQMKE